MCLRFLMRCLLIIINLAFTILGIALVVVGVLVKIKLDGYLEELKESLLDASEVPIMPIDIIDTLPIDIGVIAYVIIAIGVVIFLIAFCGCCGSITESKCLLITYSIIIGLLTVLKIAALILLLSNVESMKREVESFLEEAFNDPALNVTFHIIEVYAECCGTYGPDSYNMKYHGKDYVFPTCCGLNITNIEEMANSTDAACLKEDAYQIGCITYVVDIFESVLITTRNVLIITIISESVLLICAVTIILTIKKR